MRTENIFKRALGIVENTQHYMLDGHIVVLHACRELFCGSQNFVRKGTDINLVRFSAAARHGGKLSYQSVGFRTQSPDLIVGLTEFFRLWARLENTYVLKLFPENALNYTLDETRFTRSLSVPVNARYDADDCANAISSYIKVFDAMLKKHLSGAYSDLTAMENDYLAYLNSGALII